MSDIFGNAFCMLAALCSEDSRGGCQLVPNIHDTTGSFLDIDTRDSRAKPVRVRIYAHRLRRWCKEFGDEVGRTGGYCKSRNALGSRAWTLQERVLSRRSLCFARDQLLWECCEAQGSAQLPWASYHSEFTLGAWTARNMLAENHIETDPFAKRDCWFRLVEDYSFRLLTHETDRLPAIWGLAEHFKSNLTGGTYLSGIWSSHFPAALLWRRISVVASRPRTFLAPTWSWASLNGGISYECLRFADPGLGPSEKRLDLSEGREDPDLGLTGHLQNRRDNPLGYRDIFAITLGGAVLASVDSKYHTSVDRFYPGHQDFLTRDGATVGLLYPDLDGMTLDVEELFCLRVKEERSWSHGHKPWDLYKGADIRPNELVICLVLRKKSGSQDTYIRVGLARWVRKSLFEGSASTSIRLI